MRRVVVSGLGIVSSIGNNAAEVTESLRTARSGIVAAEDYIRLGFRSQVHGSLKINLDEVVDRRARRFQGDPVMPGCLGLDALWQLVGFFLGWMGGPGRGRALGVDEVKFTGMVLPTAKKVTYIVNLKRVIMRRLVLGIADGIMKVDGKVIYEAKGLRVGLFTDAAVALAAQSAPASA